VSAPRLTAPALARRGRECLAGWLRGAQPRPNRANYFFGVKRFEGSRSPAQNSMISYKIICSAGALVHGSNPDFLLCVANARDAKIAWAIRLPESTLRVQFFYPNRKRVPAADIAAALAALKNIGVAAAVDRRRAAGAQIPPARSEARTAGIYAAVGWGLASVVDVDFSQAGVVAPPDSPDLGKCPVDTSGAPGA
jgi:hypothetical protein